MTTSQQHTRSDSAGHLVSEWCRMRTDRPTLTDDLVTTDFRFWSDSAADSDTAFGAPDTARIVTGHQQRRPTSVVPTLVASDDRRVAFTWTAAHSDDTTITGIDVLRLGSEGKVDAAWSIVGERPDAIEDAPPPARCSAATMRTICAQWTDMWNGDTELAHDLVRDDFRIWFGTNRSADDALHGPADMQNYVNQFRAELMTVSFHEEGDFTLDAATGRAAVIWTVTLPSQARPAELPGTGSFDLGGIDLFQFADDSIARVWSITGRRPHTLRN